MKSANIPAWLSNLILGIVATFLAVPLGINKFTAWHEGRQIDINGYWSGSRAEGRRELETVMFLHNDKSKISGYLIENAGTTEKPIKQKFTVVAIIDGNEIRITQEPLQQRKQDAVVTYIGKVVDQSIRGTWSSTASSGNFAFRKED